MPTSTLARRIRRAVAWRPARTGIVEIRCNYCGVWRTRRHFRRFGSGCRKCVGGG